jgi:hypothetical protein
VLAEGDAVRGAQLYTKQGKVRVLAPVTIDASGDADLVEMAGWRTTMGDDGRVQNPTMIFRLGGVDIERFIAAYGTDTISPPKYPRRSPMRTGMDTGFRVGRSGCFRQRGPENCCAIARA